MLRQNDPVLGQQPADLVNQLRAVGRQPAAYSMKALKILLLDGLLRNEAHVGPRHGLADRLGIVGVVLLRLHIWLDELWRHQPNRMAKSAEHTRPVMRALAGFDADHAWMQFGEESHYLTPPQLPPKYRRAILSAPCT